MSEYEGDFEPKTRRRIELPYLMAIITSTVFIAAVIWGLATRVIGASYPDCSAVEPPGDFPAPFRSPPPKILCWHELPVPPVPSLPVPAPPSPQDSSP